MALLGRVKEWLGEKCLGLGMRLVADEEVVDKEPSLPEDDSNDDALPMPQPVVTLTPEARAMVQAGKSAPNAFPLREHQGERPLEGSARDRYLKARARMEMGSR